MNSLKPNFLELVIEDLPIIRPIKEFIHLNLLLPYQKLPFWEAVQTISVKLEAFAIPSMEYFRTKMKEEPQLKTLIENEIAKISDSKQQKIIYNQIFHDAHEFNQHDIRVGKLHDHWNKFIDVDIMRLADSMLIRWLGMFLDQGIASWQMPGSDKDSFYDCIKNLLTDSWIKPTPFNKHNINSLFPATADEAITMHLEYLCPIKNLQQDYARESIFTLRGWAGLIHSISKEPHLLAINKLITLNDFLAVKLILERAWIMEENKTKGQPNFKTISQRPPHPLAKQTTLKALKLCQEVYEEFKFSPYLQMIKNKKSSIASHAKFQAVFCIDDRECGIRRHLESTNSQIETFGTAGHYGIECFYQSANDTQPKKQCPLPLKPKVLIKEIKNKNKQISRRSLGGIRSTMQSMNKLFFPLNSAKFQNTILKNDISELIIERQNEDTILTNNHWVKTGYSHDEMAHIVYEQLKIIGLVNSLANLIFFIGHGSTSENNPYFTAYGCGACSGRTGSANVKILTKMANNAKVREIIKSKFQFIISENVHFVAGLHDTCSDTLTFYETHLIPQKYLEDFTQFRKNMATACKLNATERCVRFQKFSVYKFSKNKSLLVKLRSLSFFETRPELGHTDVMLAIVGRRALTQGLDLKRRAFMQSYDPAIDLDGTILSQILMAVVPVCSGINLDYFFSNVDNLRFGAGSKLPQNIVGNIGMSHGTESDLLYGLPSQMIDQHTPLRLVLIVEQSPEIALKASKCNALVQEIIHNNWIYYLSYDATSKKYYQYHLGEMREMLIKDDL